MANQISKQAILEFLNERFELAQISSNYDNQYTEFNKGKAWILENLINHIENGRFDYSNNDELQRLYEWRAEAILRDDSFTIEEANKEIIKLKNNLEVSK